MIKFSLCWNIPFTTQNSNKNTFSPTNPLSYHLLYKSSSKKLFQRLLSPYFSSVLLEHQLGLLVSLTEADPAAILLALRSPKGGLALLPWRVRSPGSPALATPSGLLSLLLSLCLLCPQCSGLRQIPTGTDPRRAGTSSAASDARLPAHYSCSAGPASGLVSKSSKASQRTGLH